jgi:hypothetical protein
MNLALKLLVAADLIILGAYLVIHGAVNVLRLSLYHQDYEENRETERLYRTLRQDQ